MSESTNLPGAGSSVSEQLNPYATPIEVADAVTTSEVTSELKQVTFGNALLRWLAIVAVCAAPSFLLGLMLAQHPLRVPAMIIGVLLFAFVYAMIDIRPTWRRWMSNGRTRKCIMWAYGLRMVSGLYPVNDMVMGMLSTSFVTAVFRGFGTGENMELNSPVTVFATTIVQGVLLNLEIFLAVLLLVGMARVWQYAQDNMGTSPDS